MDVVVYDKIGKESDRLENLLLATFPQKTITDAPIASFADGAEDIPIKQLNVAIEPVQDLHGQDAPYPAGGGKNILDPSLLKDQVAWNIIPIYVGANVTATASADMLYDSDAPVYFVLPNGTQGDATKVYKTHPVTQTAGSDGIINLIQRISDGSSSFSSYKVQIEVGSTATEWTPYSNICPISGHTECNVTRCGKNLLDTSTVTSGTITYTQDSDGYVTASDTSADARGWGYANAQYKLTLPAGTYKFVWDVKTASTNASRGYRVLNDEGTILANGYTTALDTSGASVAFTLTKATNIGVMIKQFEMVARFMIVLSTDTNTYEPHQGTTYPITFPSGTGTVYGGNITVNQDGSGTLTIDWAKYVMDGVTNAFNLMSGDEAYKFVTKSNFTVPGYNTTTTNEPPTLFCNMYKAKGVGGLGNAFVSGGLFRACIDPSFEDVASFNTYLQTHNLEYVYKLSNPTSIPLTASQITTLLGTNNLWADTGNIESLTYRANLGDYINNAITTAVANALNV